METYFNELSFNENEQLQYGDIDRLRELYQVLSAESIHVCRMNHSDRTKLILNAKQIPGANRNITDFLFSFFVSPYECECVDFKQDEYFRHEWKYGEENVLGLALAYIMDSFSISVGTGQWDVPELNITRDDETVITRNLYGIKTFQHYQEWFRQVAPIQLIKCGLSPSEKRIHLRDDHGKDILQTFCERLIKSEYVCEIVNSLPYNANQRRFVRGIKPDGLLEIVLPWTDQGLGIAVKTTGRNYRETEMIATIKQKEYGRLL